MEVSGIPPSLIIDMPKEYLSKETLASLEKEIEYLKTEVRKEISQRIEDAKKLGDLSENAEYASARELQEHNERRIGELDEIIKNAVIIQKSVQKDLVDIGSTVVIEHGGKKDTYRIVGTSEINPEKGEISNESPIGAALIGRKVGETVEVKTPSGAKKFKVSGIL